jgi:hypothetical protein
MLVTRQGLAFACVVFASVPVASAESAPEMGAAAAAAATPGTDKPVDQMWPQLPHHREVAIEDQITDHLSAIGNRVGEHIDLLSHDMFRIHVDGRAQRARMRIGGGNARYLELRVDSDWHFAEGKARVVNRVELGLAGHEINVQLPTMDLSTDSYHGAQMVQVNVPLLERHF